MTKKKKEMLLVQGVFVGLTFLLGIIVLLLARQTDQRFAQVRDFQRKVDLVSIVNAIYDFRTEHTNNLPDTNVDPFRNSFPTISTCIGTASACFDLAHAGEIEADSGNQELVVPTYLSSVPQDPRYGSASNTGYFIHRGENGHIFATASGELTQTIEISR